MRLDSRIHSSCETTIIWNGKENKEKYEPILEKALRVSLLIEETYSVLYDLRPVSLFNISESDSVARFQFIKSIGLKYLVLANYKYNQKKFINYSPSNYIQNSKMSVLKIVVAKSEKILKEIEAAYKTLDNSTVGNLLGYPEDCRLFFDNIWNVGYFDPLWQQANNTIPIKQKDENHIVLDKNKVFGITNSFLRYINLSLTSHIPCSLSCQKSYEIAIQRINLGKDLKLEGILDLELLLSLPLKWSALKGKAMIVSPYFSILTESVNCIDKFTIELT